MSQAFCRVFGTASAFQLFDSCNVRELTVHHLANNGSYSIISTLALLLFEDDVSYHTARQLSEIALVPIWLESAICGMVNLSMWIE